MENAKAVYAQSRYEEALPLFETCLALAEKEKDEKRLAAIHMRIGVLHYFLGRYPEALASQERCREWMRSMGDRAGEAMSWSNTGAVFQSRGDFTEALEAHRKSLAVFENMPGQEAMLGRVLNNIGLVHAEMGDPLEARLFYERSLRLKEASGDRAAIASTLHNLGKTAMEEADFAASLDYYGRSLEMKRREGDRFGEAISLQNLGILFMQMGDFEAASRHYAECLELRRAIADRHGIAKLLAEMGTLEAMQKNFGAAMKLYEESLAESLALGDKGATGSLYTNMGSVRRFENRLGEALALHEKAVAACEEATDFYGAAYALNNLAGVLVMQDRAGDAAGQAGRALRMAEEKGFHDARRQALHVLGMALLANPDAYTQGLEHLRAAAASVEDIRQLAGGGETRSGYMSLMTDLYEDLTEALLTLPSGVVQDSPLTVRGQSVNREGEAFSVSERMKARSFLDEMGAARFTREGAPAELLEQKRLLEARMKWLAERAR